MNEENNDNLKRAISALEYRSEAASSNLPNDPADDNGLTKLLREGVDNDKKTIAWLREQLSIPL